MLAEKAEYMAASGTHNHLTASCCGYCCNCCATKWK